MSKTDLGIYVHIPFCVKKCDYCDFPSGVASLDEQAYYIRVLKKEIRSFEPLGNLYRVKTLYFGGGTPSILDPVQLQRIVDQLKDQYEFAEDAEATIECNPGTLNDEKLSAYREMGFNRLSIGLQSANNEELAILGRIHRYQEFEDNYKLARKLGFDNINVDLMSALPGQTMDLWKNSLEKVAELEPEHISAYSLTIEEGTPFYQKYSTLDGQRMLPTEREDRGMYHFTKEFLEEKGYHRYEISNYAKEGKESRHNMTYWNGGSYVGFGLGAASYLNGKRFSNTKDKHEYWEDAKNAYQNYRLTDAQTEQATMEEFMFLGLRMMKGISPQEFEEKFHQDFGTIYGRAVEKLKMQGLLEEEGGRIRLTERGIDVSNQVLVEFLL